MTCQFQGLESCIILVSEAENGLHIYTNKKLKLGGSSFQCVIEINLFLGSNLNLKPENNKQFEKWCVS